MSVYGFRDGSVNYNKVTAKTVEVTERMYGSGMINSASGTIKYVDASNSISGDGNSWAGAYLTILEATAACRDDYSDDAESYIFIAPGSYAEVDELRIYGHGMHLIGLGQPGTDSGVNITDTDTTHITIGTVLWGAANSSIENIEFIVTQDLPALYLIASDNCLVKNCVFKGVSGTTTYAVKSIDTGTTTFCNNVIGEAGGDFTYGFYAEGDADYYLIDSHFYGNRMYADGASAVGFYIHVNCTQYGNVFERNFLTLVGSGSKGIDNNATGVSIYCDNFIVVASGATPIESASSPTGIIHNHTLAGSTVVDPNTVAS